MIVDYSGATSTNGAPFSAWIFVPGVAYTPARETFASTDAMLAAAHRIPGAEIHVTPEYLASVIDRYEVSAHAASKWLDLAKWAQESYEKSKHDNVPVANFLQTLAHPILANPATPTGPGVTDGSWAGNCQGPSCWHGAGIQVAEAAFSILGDISLATSLAGGIIRSAAIAEAKVGYSVVAEVKLPASLWGRSSAVHMNAANAMLHDALITDTAYAGVMEGAVPGITNAVSQVGGRSTPAGYVWHHAVEGGSMRLVPVSQHTPGSLFWSALHPDGFGGYASWARALGAPSSMRYRQMAIILTHRHGAMEDCANPDAIDALVGELEDRTEDVEHSSVAVHNKDGWSVSATVDGTVVFENLEDLSIEPKVLSGADRSQQRLLMKALAGGEFSTLHAYTWD